MNCEVQFGAIDSKYCAITGSKKNFKELSFLRGTTCNNSVNKPLNRTENCKHQGHNYM